VHSSVVDSPEDVTDVITVGYVLHESAGTAFQWKVVAAADVNPMELWTPITMETPYFTGTN
ncbi:hypothetical protein EV175_007436, partial [Coemansia sp. RSA 1933]